MLADPAHDPRQAWAKSPYSTIEGIELADTVDAEVEAAQRAQRLANGQAMNGASTNEASASRGGIIVADDTWRTLFEYPFG